MPVDVQTAGGDISRLVEPFPNLRVIKADGTDVLDSYRAMCEAVAWARERRGPALVHASVIRPYSHSLSDDEKLYKTPSERAREAERDPLVLFAAFLKRESILTDAELAAIAADVDGELLDAAERALAAPNPSKDSATAFVFSPTVDPTSDEFESVAEPDGTPITMVAAINKTLKAEMGHDPTIIVFGEDVADCSRPEALSEVSGKGGVFKVTHGLQRAYGSTRVFNSPIARSHHRRVGDRHGHSRHPPSCRDPVLRLHLARDAANPQRARHAPVSLEQHVFVPARAPSADRRLPARGRPVPFAVRREHLRPLPRHQDRVPVERR